LKAALDADWDDLAARDHALAEVLGLLDRVDAFVAGKAGDEAAAAVVATARQVRDQDIDLTGPAPALRRGVAKDRRISVEDAEMRHGRKSRSMLFDGYKRHVIRDLDTGLVPAVGITPANAPEASVAGDVVADLEAAGWHLSELHIDRAYLSSALVRDRGPDLAIFCKAWRVRNASGRFAKDQFTLDFAAGQLTCPAGVSMPFEPGRTVRFPAGTCAACPLQARCTASSNGRSVSIHPDEALLAELRRRQQTPDGRAKLRERVAVEHALAHVGHWQGRRARYRGTRKNLFDLRRVAVVHNLHVIARRPTTDSYQFAA
jgi:transposase